MWLGNVEVGNLGGCFTVGVGWVGGVGWLGGVGVGVGFGGILMGVG